MEHVVLRMFSAEFIKGSPQELVCLEGVTGNYERSRVGIHGVLLICEHMIPSDAL